MERDHSPGSEDETARRHTIDPDELLTSAEVAEQFGVDRRTVALWAKRGRLKATRTPGGQHRFPAGEIRRLLDADGGSADGETASD
jgi:excisionase family DNA binding protein